MEEIIFKSAEVILEKYQTTLISLNHAIKVCGLYICL